MKRKTNRTPTDQLAENLKKATTEIIILHFLSVRDCYIGEMVEAIENKSGGVLSIVFPYGVIYRMSEAGYVTTGDKRTAPDGRLRQYYRLTKRGRGYLAQLISGYNAFIQGVSNILNTTEM